MYGYQCIIALLIINANASYINQSSNFREFVNMVKGNLSAQSVYNLPINNEKLCYVKPSEQGKIYDYGSFDFVIVGAGAVGTLLANRLTEIKDWSVVLLEAGGKQNEFTDIPGLNVGLYLSDMNWGYLSTPQKKACYAMENNMCPCQRGKVIGGSTTVNVKMYVRGNKADFDEWEALGNRGWSYKDVLPYFIKTERSGIDNGDPGYHREDGLLHVNYIEPTSFTSIFLNGKKELGDKIIDYNGKDQIGVSRVQSMINGNESYGGGRAFIDPILSRRNLNVTINAFVTRLIIDETESLAHGVEFIKDGRKYRVRAKKEVILSAGALNTPQILMISGIGPKEELKKIGVDTFIDLPVGRKLEDHALFFGLNFRTNLTLFNESLEVYLENYVNNHRPLTSPLNSDTLSFINVNDKGSSVPDIQQVFVSPPGFGSEAWKLLNLKKKFKNQLMDLQKPYNDIMVTLLLLHPKSKGTVTLKSKDPLDFPLINFNYYAEEEDIETMLKAINESLKLLETDAFKSVNATYVPTFNICTNYTEGTDGYWRCMLKQLTTNLYHSVRTTPMGKSRKESVVSSELRVHGMKNLRVVDAGVMPRIPSGNTNAPTYMIAEKAADFIKEHWFKIG